MKNLRIYSRPELIESRKIHEFVSGLTKLLNLQIKSLEISFVSQNEIIDVNKKYLKHNYSTDIITFNYSTHNNIIDGEVLISIDDAAKNAKKYRISVIEEICRLIIHGILHLIGYDDGTITEKRKMKSKENELLNRFKFILLKGLNYR